MTTRAQPSPLLSLVLLAAAGIAIAAYHSLLLDIGWWVVTFGISAVVLGAMALARRLSRRAWVPPVAGLVAAIVSLTLGFVPGSALLGVIPTFDTIGAYGDLARAGVESIATQGIPANATAGIVFLLAGGFALVALVLDLLTFSLRRPALTGIPMLLLIAVPSLIDTTIREPIFFVLMAVAYFALLLSQGRRSQRAIAITMSGIAIVGALVVSVVLPPVISNASTNQHSNGYVTGLNPFINLGQDLRRGDPVTTIEYSTTSDVPQYFTVTVLKDFDGDAWRPVDREGGIDRIDDIGPVPGRDDKATTATVETTVTIGNVIGRWLPVPYAPRSIEGLDGAWEWNPETLSLWSTDANVAGQTYSVRADLATPSAQELVATGTDRPGGLNAYLRLPEGLDPIVAETAREVVGDVTTNYEKAIALQSYFRSGEFEYSVDAPVDEGYDGPSADVIAKFLKVKSGYCVHFASAFATMARTLDIPARIGVGFTSGERVGAGENGASNYVVTTHDLHAWPELFFDSIGWVRFEPTVGRGLVPAFGDLQADDPETPEFEPTQTPSATPTAGSNTPSATSTPQANDRPDELDPDTGITPRTRANLTWAGILAAVALVLLLPAMWRTGRRARRFRRVRSDGSPFEAWNEIRDTAVDLGSAATESETPRAFAAAITPRLQPNGVDALQRLLATVEAEAYAPDAARRKAGAADLRTVVVALRARAGIAARLRARFVPASVLGRRRVEQPEL